MIQDQERRALLAIFLSVVVFVGWQALFPPPPPPELPAEGAPGAPAAGAPEGPSAAAPALRPTAAEVPAHAVPFASQGVRADVASANGAPRGVEVDGYDDTVQVYPLWSWLWDKVSGAAEGGWQPYAGGDTPRRVLSVDGALVLAGAGPLDDDGAGTPDGPSAYTVQAEGEGVVATRASPGGLQITKRYRPGPYPYTLTVEVELRNGTGATLPQTWVGVAEVMTGAGGGMFSQGTNFSHPQAYVEDLEGVLSADEVAGEDAEDFTGEVSWFGVADRYFLAALVPDGLRPGKVRMDQLPGGRVGSFLVDPTPLDAGSARTYRFTAYAGPKEIDALRALGQQLDEAVEYGWFGFFSKILLFAMKLFHTAVGNWGWSIILVTMFIKLLFYPLNQRAYMSSERMKQLQPELDQLREKYKDDQALQSQEMMKLWSQNGVSPLGGCLPMLVQLPVFFALYNVMYSSVELYDTSFFYLKDLTAADPTGVITTVYTLLMVLQQRMMPMGNMDPAQQQIMKLMPLFFAFVMYSFPSGLVLYFCVNMLLTILQQWWIRRRLSAAPATT